MYRFYKNILISFFLFGTLCTFAAGTIPLTLDRIYSEYRFYPRSIDGMQSMADGEHYTVLEKDADIVAYDYKTGEIRRVLFSAGNARQKGLGRIDDYAFSSDENMILLSTAKSPKYRHSYEARYYTSDLRTGKTEALEPDGMQQLATLSPDGTHVAWVRDNNLFCKNLTDKTITQLTTDGQFNHIINGAPDWVYEEEFTLLQAFAWSPDSRKIAFMRFDETEVPEFCMTLFQNPYPTLNCFKYPKAGEKNAHVEVRVIDLQTGKTAVMDAGSEADQYIPRIQWTRSADTVSIIRLNRLQNRVDVLFAHAGNGNSRIAYSETNSRYITEIDDNYIHFTKDGSHFIIRSEISGFNHYYRFTLGGKLVNAITKGDWDTDAILGYDDAHGCLYYTSSEATPLRRSVCCVRYDGSRKTTLPGLPGTNSAQFSRNFRFYINTWSDANTPNRITLHKIDGTVLRVLEDNAEIREDMKVFGFTPKKFISIPVSGTLSLNAYLVLPADFDSTKQYPLFIKVYGGPESQEVIDAWDTDLAWEEYLAHQGIVVACIDNRGTDGRGEDFRKSTYLQLGRYETEDQIAAARWLGRKSWIDESRIGIWGWSYGGYMTLLCMTKGADVFKMGISVSPVTNWRFYDTIFTERFMRTPAENEAGYDQNSPIYFTSRLKGKLLLVHGTGDDNVHFQNSAEMVSQLIKDGKQIEVFYYPNKNHNISGGNTRLHLFTMISQFVTENL